MRSVKQKAYAKINLSLDILGRLENGYHIVKMVMQTIDLSDELIFETQDRECPSMEITLVTDNGEIPGGEDNLIVRAVRRMEYKYGIRRDLRITLKKNIPVAAGMAGGSTDAAAALRAVRDLFVPDVSDEELQKIGVTLGADIPYCVTGGTQLSEGIGEVLTVLPDAPQCGLVICKPPVGVSTGEVYKRYDREIERFFEKEGALVSKMSGSGPTVFAVFADKQEAVRAAQAFEAADEAKDCRIIVCDFVYRIMEDANGRQ